MTVILPCEACQKPQLLCVCDNIKPQKTKTRVLILQHPQEPDHLLGSALLAHLALPNSLLKVGLSWRSLGAILETEVVAKRWAVLYLGSGVKELPLPKDPLLFVSQQGKIIPRVNPVEGIIVLDGTWSQAKALWWRNAWLLKCQRVILPLKEKSLYGKLRKEPRKECLSTIESIASVLDALGESPTVATHLRELFATLLCKYREIN